MSLVNTNEEEMLFLYKDESIEQIVIELQDNYSNARMLELYSNTMWYAKKLSYSYCWNNDVSDDFMQISYIALSDAVKSFKPGKQYPFLAYYRKWLIHYFYRYTLEMRFPVKVPRDVDIKTSISDSITERLLMAMLTTTINSVSSFEKVELEILKEIIWERVDTDLSDENSRIIRGRFLELRTLSSLGEEFDIGAERVRLREIRSLKKLSHDETLQEIALNFFHDGDYVFDSYTVVA